MLTYTLALAPLFATLTSTKTVEKRDFGSDIWLDPLGDSEDKMRSLQLETFIE